ncbi:MAG: hypothetical protein JWN34_1946 [Bryobacterales bacterium]|jgi:hypothetical protein|nr:hypothetical protein [Bryobacterales bacterium]
MNRYKIRVHKLSALGFLTQADHFEDYYLDFPGTLEAVAGHLSAKGFAAGDGKRWIMPGAIAWIEQD